ncbi:restriction endonuclease [Micromonospora chersina]|uniref:restriction endonuclease n=1 Tax=Micromonospora chersina TaxID=47854 RepID=UPI003D949305
MDGDSADLRAWLSEVEDSWRLDDDEGRQIWQFSSDELLSEYLSSVNNRPEEEVRSVLTRLLIPSVALVLDHTNFELYLGLQSRTDPEAREILKAFNNQHFSRVLRYYSGKTNQLPWEGITWVMELLPRHPRIALEALEAYFTAHAPYLSDSMIHALSDAEEIIRARYIGLPESSEERRHYLLNLSSRQFEQIVEHLYDAMGYDTELTPPQSDGGRDIIAIKRGPGQQEHIFIECKRYEAKVGVRRVRELAGVVSSSLVNKGILVTTATFTAGARAFAESDRRLELLSGAELVTLINKHLGWDWPARLERLGGQRPFRRLRSSRA